MVITLLCEPRSGSTNLANWFYLNRNFTTLFEPLNPISEWYQKDINPKDYKYTTEHLCVKEVYYPHKQWDDLIKASDKIIVLYRENEIEQIESFINAIETKNWDGQYIYKGAKEETINNKTSYFKTLKQEFYNKYCTVDNYFKISYEDLYQRNKFQHLLDYLDLGLKNEKFPYGVKYRITNVSNRLI